MTGNGDRADKWLRKCLKMRDGRQREVVHLLTPLHVTGFTTMSRPLFAIVALITLCALPLASRAQAPASVPLPAPLERVLRDYEAGWAKGDAAGLARLFAPDGFALPNHKPPARGHAAIAAAYAGSSGALRLRALAYATSDSVGYIVGAYSYGERTGPDVGKFVLALRRVVGGQWLIAADIDNSVK